MAGHILVDYFRRQGVHSVFYTTRDVSDPNGLLLDVNDCFMVDRLVEAVHPDVIVNAVGVLNSFADEDKITAYHINGFLPHRLRRVADTIGARLIHISTDCVFSGDRGRTGRMMLPMEHRPMQSRKHSVKSMMPGI